jgi:hypothetical protein
MIYLRDYVKPVMQKVSNGKAITTADYNIVAKENKAQEIINTEKNTTATSYAEQKKIKSTTTIAGTPTISTVDTVGAPEASISTGNWATVNAGGGQEIRTITTTTPNYRTTTTTSCTVLRTTLLNGTTVDSACTYGPSVVETITLDPTVIEVTETREGDNPIINTETLNSIVNTVTEIGAQYVVTNYADAENTNAATTNGTAVTTSVNRDVFTDVNNGDNTTTRTTVRYVDTTVITPVTTTITRTRTYTDITKQNSRTITTTTPQTKVTYKDGTSETVSGTATVVTSDWQINQISMAKRTEDRFVSESTANTILTSSDSGIQIAQVTITNSYTDND